MIKQMTLSGFKAVQGPNQVDILPFTVLIGRNASGKSSIIEALEWLSIAVRQGAEVATEKFVRIEDLLNRHGEGCPEFRIKLTVDPEDASVGDEVTYELGVTIDQSTRQPRVSFEELTILRNHQSQTVICTVDGVRQYAVDISAPRIEGQSRAPRRTRRIYERKTGEITSSSQQGDDEGWFRVSDPDRLLIADIDPLHSRAAELLARTLETTVFLRLNPRSIGSFSSDRSRRSPALLEEQGQNLAGLLAELDQETRSILTEKLTFILTGATGIEPHLPTGPSDRSFFVLQERLAKHESSDIPAWMLSEGTRRVTAILAVLLHDVVPELICIEEIENGIDPWTLRFLIDELASAVERGVQVIITTHSPYLLDLIPMECVILCERGEKGALFTNLAEHHQLDELRTRLGLGELYTNRFLYTAR